jgi:hypothetical protein
LTGCRHGHDVTTEDYARPFDLRSADDGRAGLAQVPPSTDEIARYTGLHEAAAKGDIMGIAVAGMARANLEQRDSHGRTPLHVAVFQKQYAAARALLTAGADANALENQKYDIVTIASVANDVEMLKLALAAGASARNVTSPYEGTALIAAAHLGHAEVVKTLIAAKAPLDHVNNLGWTALDRAAILGDGRNHGVRAGAGGSGSQARTRRPAGGHATRARAPARLCRDDRDPGARRSALKVRQAASAGRLCAWIDVIVLSGTRVATEKFGDLPAMYQRSRPARLAS